MTNEKSETTQTVTMPLIQVLEERSIDLSQPKEIKEFLSTLEWDALIAFFPLVNKRLMVEGMYRQLSASNAKGHKVGASEYGDAIRAGLAVWERGYLTSAEEERAQKSSVGKGTSKGRSLPFTQAMILARMGELAPSGKSDKAKRVAEVLGKLSAFSSEAFTAYYVKSLENPSSLVASAVRELASEQAAKVKADMEEMLGGVDLI